MTLTELATRVGVTVVNLSVLKNDRARAIRFSTLTAICEADVSDVRCSWTSQSDARSPPQVPYPRRVAVLPSVRVLVREAVLEELPELVAGDL